MNLLRVARNGKEIGRWAEDDLVERLAAGELQLTDYVWWDGALSWVELATLVDSPMQRMATEEQREALMCLGYEGDLESMTEDLAKVWIGKLLENHTGGNGHADHLNNDLNGHHVPTEWANQSRTAEHSILYWLRFNVMDKSRCVEYTTETIARYTQRIRLGIREIRNLEIQLSSLPGNESAGNCLESRELLARIESRRENIREFQEELAAEQAKLPGLRHQVRVALKLRFHVLKALFTGSLHLDDSDDYIVLHRGFEDLDNWHRTRGARHQVPSPERLKEVVAILDHQEPDWEIHHPEKLFDSFPLK